MSAPVTTAPAPVTSQTTEDDLDHYVCCDPNEAFCGIDATDLPWVDVDGLVCVVCEDLTCKWCGE